MTQVSLSDAPSSELFDNSRTQGIMEKRNPQRSRRAKHPPTGTHPHLTERKRRKDQKPRRKKPPSRQESAPRAKGGSHAEEESDGSRHSSRSRSHRGKKAPPVRFDLSEEAVQHNTDSSGQMLLRRLLQSLFWKSSSHCHQ
jgi:hypothetical protein